jgi:hypothetical protein
LPGAGNTGAATLLAAYRAGESGSADTGAMGRKTNLSLAAPALTETRIKEKKCLL